MTRHQLTRVRHEVRRRTLTVTAIETLAPRFRRIHFHADDLGDFVSASADDHIKLFFIDDDGQTAMRDFTPRRFDPAAGTLVIEFALHDAGPATRWARAAQTGDTLDTGGPRGSTIIPDDFDWVLLIGDETALPSIGRRVEELRAGVPVIAIGLVDGPEAEIAFTSPAALDTRWVHRCAGKEDAALLIAAIDTLPAGEGFVWIAAETTIARTLRAHVLDTLGQPREWIKASGYWTRGEADASTRQFDD